MTALYVPIEQLATLGAHPSFDIWALAITLYVLMAKKEPYQQAVVERLKAIQENQREKLPEHYSQALRDLVDYLLIVN
jgi:serine/threonine protein kinase